MIRESQRVATGLDSPSLLQPVQSAGCPHLKNFRENLTPSSSLPTTIISLRGYVIFPYSQIMRFCVSALTKHDGTYQYLGQNMFVATLKSFPTRDKPRSVVRKETDIGSGTRKVTRQAET